MGTKKCSKCGEHKDLEAFHKDLTTKDGLQYRCKACRRKHYLENVGDKKEYDRRHYHKNAEAKRAHQRQYHRANPDRAAAGKHRRRARKAAVPSDGFVLDIKGQDCYVCGKPAEAVDHIVPLSKGGPNTRINLAPICKGCNSSKSASVWPGMVEWEGFVARRRALAGA